MRPLMLLHYLTMLGTPGLLILIALFKVLSVNIIPLLLIQGILALIFSILTIYEYIEERRIKREIKT